MHVYFWILNSEKTFIFYFSNIFFLWPIFDFCKTLFCVFINHPIVRINELICI
ncbi:hypothetical protein TSAR_014561 [Trichomalopsis sarcophagae]|uniref:Uncharacterized protein n=1 Tax=Trichomalopsis sarcophagae TaxID=543379 RepID=A0A232EDN4_9HYME|nr:hypothetical protein TSAR_014561 [Trichomalopsis sarcophagae]